MATQLPVELLHKILGYLESPEDLENAGNAMMLLGEILAPKKTQFLFHKVLPLILEREPFSAKEIINWRMVCSQWKEVIDNLICRRPSISPYNDSQYLKRMRTPLGEWFRGETSYSHLDPVKIISNLGEADNDHRPEDFIHSYEIAHFANGRNPFVGKTILIRIGIGNFFGDAGFVEALRSLNDLMAQLPNFFHQFGHFIEHARIEASHFLPIELTFMISMMCGIMCPNVKTLIIVSPGYVTFQDADIREALEAVNIEESTFPRLQTLEISGTSRTPTNLMKPIITSHLMQLQKLTVCEWDITGFENELPNLKELCVFKISSNASLKKIVPNNAPNLEKLTLYFHCMKINMDVLRNVLQKIPLRFLQLNWLNNRTGHIMATVPPSPTDTIQTLHTLTIDHCTRINYSFIRWFPNLRFLNMKQNVRAIPDPIQNISPSTRIINRISRREVIKIHKYVYEINAGMNLSNVWTLLPMLTVISYERIKRLTLPQLQQRQDPERMLIVWKRDVSPRIFTPDQ